jgi:hypothetical protein
MAGTGCPYAINGFVIISHYRKAGVFNTFGCVAKIMLIIKRSILKTEPVTL